MYLKRGSIGVRTQNICFQEEKPIVGRIVIEVKKIKQMKLAQRDTSLSFIWVRTQNISFQEEKL